MGHRIRTGDLDADVGNAIPVDFMGRKMAYDNEMLERISSPVTAAATKTLP